MTGKDTLIRVKNLYKVFGKKPHSVMHKVHEGLHKDEFMAETGHTLGLRDINLKIKKGEVFVIMGLSGSGKSTLIRHFNRLIDPTEGSILIDEIDVMHLSQKELENSIEFESYITNTRLMCTPRAGKLHRTRSRLYRSRL